MTMRTILVITFAVLAVGLPGVAHAYVGPGAGLGLVAAFWAIVVALGAILAFTLMWPIRRLLRHRRDRNKPQTGARRDESPAGHDAATRGAGDGS